MGAIMIRQVADVCRIAKSVLGGGSVWLLGMAAIMLLQVAGAGAVPGPGAYAAANAAGLPLLQVRQCADGRPCPDYVDAPVPREYPVGYDRDPPPYPPQDHEDCIEDPHAARLYPVRTPPAPYYGDPMREEPCGIRCWYQRLRAGYCGRGCDYYRYRMTAFPEGHLGDGPRRVACRVDR